MRAGCLGSAACPLHPRPLFFSSERVLSIEVLKNMAILPAVAFAVLATLILYASVRGYRRFFPSNSALSSAKSASLPEPVVGKSSGWSWARLNLKSRWPRRLSLSGIPRVRVRVPWSRSASLDGGVAPPKTKNSKNLGIELLPTTGLPPPPSSLPMPTPTPTPTPAPSTSHVLVDVSVSSEPPPPAPALPRAPSPPFPAQPVPGGYFSSAKALLLPLHQHHSARPPSPHALLATTPPPKNHKRSRSLGGVPVRRLSSGAGSALRHAHAVEMDDLGVRNGHVRDTSREHLLIDFSSSSSSSYKNEPEDDADISPAASDIGVLPLNAAPLRTRSESPYPYGYAHEAAPFVLLPPPPPPPQPFSSSSNTPIAVRPKQVARQVPLVDLEDEEELDDSWKWFSAAAPVAVASALVPAAAATRAVVPSKAAVPTSAIIEIEMTPLGAKTASAMLVDLDDDPPVDDNAQRTPELGSQVRLVDVEERNYEEGILVDVSEKPARGISQAEREVVARPKAAEAMVAQAEVPLPIDHVDGVSEDPFADPPHTHAEAEAEAPTDSLDDPFADPLDLPAPAARELPPTPRSGPVALSAEPDRTSDAGEALPATVEGAQETWSWADSHDPWHGHVGDDDDEQHLVDTVQQGESDVAADAPQEDETPDEAAPVAQDDVIDATPDPEADTAALLEHSPAGVLNPTVVGGGHADTDADSDSGEEADEHIPPLDLSVSAPEKRGPELLHKDDADAADEDTPKATPASLTHELPPWGPLEALPVDDDDYYGVASASEESADGEARPAADDPAALSPALGPAEYDDPELLELPLALDPLAPAPFHGHEATAAAVAAYFDELAADDAISLALAAPGGALFRVEHPSADDDGAHRENEKGAGDGQHTPTRVPLAQTPTPPASPPPPPPLGTRALRFGSNYNSRAVSPVALSAPLLVLSKSNDERASDVKATRAVREEEGDKENVAPPMVMKSSTSEDSATQARPAWSLRAQDAPALGVPSAGYVLGSSPRAMKRALSSEAQKEPAPVSIKETKLAVVDVATETQVSQPVVDVLVETAVIDTSVSAPTLSKETEPAGAPQIALSDSLPGTFPEPAAASKTTVISPPTDDLPSTPSPTAAASTTAVSITAPTRRRTLSQAFAYTLPSVRRLARSPLDVALAMQLRPGLGAGADPAWMVRFLMAMYGWLAVVIAGQDF